MRILDWLFPDRGQKITTEQRGNWHCVHDAHGKILHRGDAASAAAFVAAIREREFMDEVERKAW
jgi:hypothetical protein